MASASTKHPSPQRKFDVFISFRGFDTRQNILSHLKVALSRANIATFIDDRLNRGDKITEALPTAIEESKLSIVLFSENYANSRCCLDELVKILECKRKNGQIVVPVFYNVNPSVVRNQTGSFAEAFAEHSEKKFHKISMWKDALKEAADLSGWDSHVTRARLKVRGIVLDTSTLQRVIRVSATAFKRMDNLRLLQITDDYWHNCKVQLPQGLESLPDELRYLRWDDYPLAYLPTGFDPVNLKC